MRPIQRLLVHLVVVAGGLSLAAPLAAQSGATATVSGTVTGPGDRPIPGSLVTLTSLTRGGDREATADASGAFRFALVTPGTYELRAEALGYRPVVARTLELAGGGRATVVLPMVQATPPVLQVDTIPVFATGGSRFEPGGLRLGPEEIDRLPNRFEEVSGLAALDPFFDGSLGSLALPGSLDLLVVDGVPFYRAPHPTARAEQLSGAAFPRTALQGMTVLPDAPGVEYGGSAGGHVALTTLSGTPGGGLELEGAWSGAPLWSSSELDFSTPSLVSFQGAGRATIPVTPGSSQVVVSGEAFRQDTPLTPRVGEGVATGLAGLDPDLVARLTEPSVEQYSRYSGLMRFDANSSTSHLFLRGAAGYAKREFDGPGPVTLARDAAPPEESIEYSVASGYVKELRSNLSFELRGGISGGTRTFDPAETGMPAAYLVGSGSDLGVLAMGQGESARTDFLLTPILRYGLGGGTLEFGADLRLTKNTQLRSQPASYLYSDAPTLVADRGYVETVDAPKVSFSTQQLGGFVQFGTELGPGLQASIGGRFDYERIPQDATLNADWLLASGLRNDDYKSGLSQLGGHAVLTWDAAVGTRVFATLSARHGDVDSRVLTELFAQDVGATQTTYAGSGLTWPGGMIPGGATTLPTVTLVGPDTRAPRSLQADAGIVQRLAGGWSLHLGGSVRRTDFLMRRRNLNLPTTPQSTDPDGRSIYGTLQQDGSLITATDPDARRFADFSAVWALDPDGWSKYVGGTAGLEYTDAAVDLFVAYSRSQTTDNWVGASRGAIGAELAPLVPEAGWTEGTSDYDVPDRITAAATARASLATVSAVYRFRSGLPFTPRYRDGVDANGDGSLGNDVAFVDAAVVDPLLADWPCLQDQVAGFAVRNSCRGPSVHSLDLRLSVRVGQIAGRDASLVLDGFNLIESKDGVIDDALLLVDPTESVTTSGATVTIPFVVNPDFGNVLYPTSRGRMLRVGFRIG